MHTACVTQLHHGKKIKVGIERPQSLDPAQARTPSELLVADQLFDSLTAYDPETLAVQPAGTSTEAAQVHIAAMKRKR